MGIRMTRCPKRIEEGGIIGTLDIGECDNDCAAFSSDWKQHDTEDEFSKTKFCYYQGHCAEYKRGVVARAKPISR